MRRIALAQTLIVALLVVSVVGLQPIKASPRTIVVPDDYATISLAIEKALDGDTIFVKKGVYQGPRNQTLYVNTTISLAGEDAKDTVINLHPPLVPMNIFTFEYMGYLDAIRIYANGVKLSGLTIISDGGSLSATGNGTQISGNNMNFRVSANGYGTRIIDNTLAGIALFGSNQTIAQNIIQKGTDEFRISCVGSYNKITSNTVAGSGGGIYTKGSHNIIHGNSITAESGINAGVEVNGNENILYNNSISNFVCVGSTLVPETSSNIICGNTIANNIAAVGNSNTFKANYVHGVILGNTHQDASNNIFYHNNFDFISNEALPAGERTFTVWKGVQGAVFMDNGEEGNYYSDYNGSDLNSDDIGDTPYVIVTKDPSNYHYTADFDIADRVLTDHYPLMTPFDISSVTMELPEWEYTQQFHSPSSSPPPTLESTPTPSATSIPSQAPKSTPEPQNSESFQTPLVNASVATVAVIAVGLLFYFNKRKNGEGGKHA